MVEALSRFGQNLFQPPEDNIRGVDSDAWMSPLQPVRPMGPPGTEPREFQYWEGQNLLWTPRADAEYSAADLKQLATYPLARIAIENVKDSICKSSWEIQNRPQPGEPRKAAAKRGIGDPNLVKVNKFFEKPDRLRPWPDWVRPLIDDMLTIDAASILIRKTFSGEIVELPTVFGESIVRYVDENGFTPMPPQPAYAQNWYGIPLVNLTTDQLIYKPRNIARRNTIASCLYGFSATEQLAPEIEIGMQRLAFTKAYFTEGSIPGVVQVVPKGVSTDKIAEAMQWMNSELSGNLAARRQWRMIQGFNEPGKDEQIIFTKEPLLADIWDDQHTKRIFYGYGVSPQRVQKQMNRACHSWDTETLTENGWKRYEEIGDSERIAQFNPDSLAIEYVIPERRFLYPFSGEMIHFKTQQIDVLVTPEHDMWARTAYRNYSKIKASKTPGTMHFIASAMFCGEERQIFELPPSVSLARKLSSEAVADIRSSSVDRRELAALYGVTDCAIKYVQTAEIVPTGNVIPGASIQMDDWLEFLGYYLSEGGLSHADHHYLLTLSQSADANHDKADRIEACLNRLPFAWNPYPEQKDGMRRWNVYGKPVCT